MKMLKGSYEMGIGFGSSDIKPPIFMTLIKKPGDSYEMTHPDGWHYVCPISEPVFTLMITGKPWDKPRISPRNETPLPDLSSGATEKLFEFFRCEYQVNC